MISDLEDKLTTVQHLRKQDTRNLKFFFKGLVKNAIQQKNQDE